MCIPCTPTRIWSRSCLKITVCFWIDRCAATLKAGAEALTFVDIADADRIHLVRNWTRSVKSASRLSCRNSRVVAAGADLIETGNFWLFHAQGRFEAEEVPAPFHCDAIAASWYHFICYCSHISRIRAASRGIQLCAGRLSSEGNQESIPVYARTTDWRGTYPQLLRFPGSGASASAVCACISSVTAWRSLLGRLECVGFHQPAQ